MHRCKADRRNLPASWVNHEAINLLECPFGGVTAVINASAAAVIAAARTRPERVGKVFAARRGILGVLAEDLYDTEAFDEEALARLMLRPGGAFGSCRFDLPSEDGQRVTDRLFEVFAAHDIGYFLYNGGNGSMDAVARLHDAARERGYPLVCVGVPKTVDNDIVGTDCCPGVRVGGEIPGDLDARSRAGHRVDGRQPGQCVRDGGHGAQHRLAGRCHGRWPRTATPMPRRTSCSFPRRPSTRRPFLPRSGASPSVSAIARSRSPRASVARMAA